MSSTSPAMPLRIDQHEHAGIERVADQRRQVRHFAALGTHRRENFGEYARRLRNIGVHDPEQSLLPPVGTASIAASKSARIAAASVPADGMIEPVEMLSLRIEKLRIDCIADRAVQFASEKSLPCSRDIAHGFLGEQPPTR